MRLRCVDIRHRPELQAVPRPPQQRVAVGVYRGRTNDAGCRPYEEVDHVPAASIHERRNDATLDVVETAAGERKTVRCEFDDRRSEVDLAVEPGFTR